MRKLILIISIFTLFFGTGCTRNEAVDKTENEIKKLQEIIESQKKDIEDLEHINKVLIEEKNAVELDTTTSTETTETIFEKPIFSAFSVNNESISYVAEKLDESVMRNITIIGEGNDIVEEFDVIELKSIGNMTGEIVKIQVVGMIYDFKTLRVEYENDILVEKETIEEIMNIENSVLLLDTYLPCGAPFSKLKWKNQDGEQFECYLSSDGYGFDGEIIWCR